jgi:F0F1-type ATP synthase assembly protein I
MTQPPPRPAEQFRSFAYVYVMVSEFVVPIVLGLLVDWGFSTGPWGAVVGVLLGMTLGTMRVLQYSRKLAESDRRPKGGDLP